MVKEAPRSRFQLPGFGLPIDFVPSLPKGKHPHEGSRLGQGGVLFRNALSNVDRNSGEVQLPLTTLREFTMLRLMNAITDKPDWHVKVFDEAITSKWEAEALSTGEDITQKMVDWCIVELQCKAKTFEETGAVSVFNGDVVKSDTAVPTCIQEELKAAVKPLEDVPEKFKDWHPDSGEKILDLVHPSLFPLVYDRTRILPKSLTNIEDCIKRCGEGKIAASPPRKMSTRSSNAVDLDDTEIPVSHPYSKKFQWLPCEVDISSDEGPKITSYINNLHPQRNKDLYRVIERIIGCVIPMWNMTLTALKAPDESLPRIVYTDCIYDPDPESWPETEGPQQGEDEDEDTYNNRREDWYLEVRQVVKPEPEEFKAPVPREPGQTVDLRRDYGERGLQIIVKLANIELTPEKPEYEGGTWHVEGQLNEHICASAIYYYNNDNIASSYLAFRQQSTVGSAHGVKYPQNHDDWLEVIFGCSNWEAAVQQVGSIETKEGRVLTWPNILQHQVQPFKLEDPTKPGHRKILAFFLVDPNIRIISTANVPCQRKDWWMEVVQGEASGLTELPVELQDAIFKDVDDFPIDLDEAKELREELMKERKKFVVAHGEAFEENQFSLCEH